MKIVVLQIKILLIFSVVALLASCGSESASSDNQGFYASIDSLPLEFESSILKFLNGLVSRNLEDVYAFAAPEYFNTIPFSTFERFFESDWMLEDVQILSSTHFENSFYLVIRTVSKNSHKSTLSYDVML